MKKIVFALMTLYSVSIFAADEEFDLDSPFEDEAAESSTVELLPFVDPVDAPEEAANADELELFDDLEPAPEVAEPVLETPAIVEPVVLESEVELEPEIDALDAIAEQTVVEVVEPEITDGIITLKTPMSTSLQGYAGGPLEADKAVLILHDRWGVDKTIKAWVDRFADMGYRALAIDVFDGRISKKAWLAEEIMGATDPETVKTNIQGGLNYLKAPGRKIITLGAGYGGWQSFQASVNSVSDVAATIVLYGRLDATVDQFRSLQAPVLAIYAADDPRITEQTIDDYRIKMKKSFVTYRTQVVPAGHGFMDPAYETYDELLANDTWREIDNFLAGFLETAGE